MSGFNLDGKTYHYEDLSDKSRGEFLAIQFARKEIERLDRRAGVLKTARNMYGLALTELLPDPIDSMKQVEGAVLNLNDRKYLRSELSDAANAQLKSLLEVDRLLEEVMNDYSIAETARKVYGQQFRQSLAS